MTGTSKWRTVKADICTVFFFCLFTCSGRVFDRDGAKVVIDQLSLDLLKGSTIDFHKELIRSSFRIVGNPNAEHGCSCGASFALK